MLTPRPLAVLIVDSDPAAADTLGHLLRLMGHGARVAAGGSEAIDVGGGFTPDVMVVDIDVPSVEPHTVAVELHWAAGDGPLLVAVTGFQNLERWSRANGFDYHLVKPVTPEALRDLLARCAERLAVRESDTDNPGPLRYAWRVHQRGLADGPARGNTTMLSPTAG